MIGDLKEIIMIGKGGKIMDTFIKITYLDKEEKIYKLFNRHNLVELWCIRYDNLLNFDYKDDEGTVCEKFIPFSSIKEFDVYEA